MTAADRRADPDVDLAQVRTVVDRAVRAAVPAGQMFERKIRPESDFGWPEPRPLAGLRAALTVARMAQDQAYKFAAALRGEGSSWPEIADLLEIPWSEEYVRPERAYQLVAGIEPGTFSDARVYWRCGGLLGCGQHITDRGPYNGHPRDNEDGHADGCARRPRTRLRGSASSGPLPLGVSLAQVPEAPRRAAGIPEAGVLPRAPCAGKVGGEGELDPNPRSRTHEPRNRHPARDRREARRPVPPRGPGRAGQGNRSRRRAPRAR